MNDDVAGVDQHPVAGLQTLDGSLAMSGILQRPQHAIGHGADMPVRTPGGDDPWCQQSTIFQSDQY